MYMCPYYNENYQTCNFYQTSQSQYQRDNYCNTSSNWKYCANYDKSSREQKVQKKLRSNQEL